VDVKTSAVDASETKHADTEKDLEGITIAIAGAFKKQAEEVAQTDKQPSVAMRKPFGLS